MRKIKSALIVDDDAPFRTTLQGALRRRGIVARTAATVDEALIALEDEAADLILVDQRMPKRDGLSALGRCRQLRPDAVIAMLTGFGDIPLAVSAIREGADAFFTKPIDLDRLLEEVENVLDRPRSPSSHLPAPSGVYNLEDLEKQVIRAALQEAGGVVAQAAKLLGIDRRTLQRKLKKL